SFFQKGLSLLPKRVIPFTQKGYPFYSKGLSLFRKGLSLFTQKNYPFLLKLLQEQKNKRERNKDERYKNLLLTINH
ncbi:MAG: hypothetical protein LBL13_06810, partial [Bacteroidales bacterium]|nr:hypothetical protein [Bacteroidales bacterium]